jgi:hypothetical protein
MGFGYFKKNFDGFWFFKKIRIKEPAGSVKSKNCQFWVFQNPQRTFSVPGMEKGCQ